MSTMRWFGQKLSAPVYDDCPQVEIPVGQNCVYCQEPIADKDNGFVDAAGSAMHRACFLRDIVGSIRHQLKMCSCFGGCDRNDEPELTVRQEAEKAVAFYEANRMPAR